MTAPAALLVALLFIGGAVGLCGARVVRGPTAFDRILAFECLTLESVGAVVLISMAQRTDAYLDVALVVALLGFLVTMALAAFMEGTLVE